MHSDIKIEGPSSCESFVRGDHAYEIGAYTYINGGGAFAQFSIGRYCSVSGNVWIGQQEHPTAFVTTATVGVSLAFLGWYDLYKAKHGAPEKLIPGKFSGRPFTRIGNDVWIGGKVTLKAGVTVGDGAVIGAGSIVVKDVPPYAIVAGAPAKLIRFRFPEPIVERLRRLRWWDYHIFDLLQVSPERIEAWLDYAEDKIGKASAKKIEDSLVTSQDIQRLCEALG